jgi:hypothetical protein
MKGLAIVLGVLIALYWLDQSRNDGIYSRQITQMVQRIVQSFR